MKTPYNTDEQALKASNRLVIFMVGFSILMVSVVILPSLFIRQTEIVTMTRVDAARECRSRRSLKIWPKYRSTVPKQSIGYCGLIMSDHGSFKLPETTWLNLWGTSREDLHDKLVVGCTYKVVVTGLGLELRKGQPMSNSNRMLESAIPSGECVSSVGNI